VPETTTTIEAHSWRDGAVDVHGTTAMVCIHGAEHHTIGSVIPISTHYHDVWRCSSESCDGQHVVCGLTAHNERTVLGPVPLTAGSVL